MGIFGRVYSGYILEGEGIFRAYAAPFWEGGYIRGIWDGIFERVYLVGGIFMVWQGIFRVYFGGDIGGIIRV